MISFQKAYVVGTKVFATLKEAQVSEMLGLLAELIPVGAIGDYEPVAIHLVENSERVLDILTTTDKSRPRARKVNGGKKPRNVTKLTQTEMTAQ